MKRPVRTTIVFALVSAFTVMPAAWLLAGPLGWPMALKLALWTDLACYTVLLARWSGKSPLATLFPLFLLLGAALWPRVTNGFIFLGLGVFGWIRSGICFTRSPLRAVFAEIFTIAIGIGLVALMRPASTLAWAIGIWLFYLVQTLYFFIVPLKNMAARGRDDVDRFERARRDAQRILDAGSAS
jgi:hypothetical protein